MATRRRRVKKGRPQRRTRRQRRVRFNLKGGSSSPLYEDAYVITMPEFPERFRRVNAFATAAGIPLKQHAGVRVRPQERDSLPPLGIGTTHFKDRTGATYNLGAIGAFLAHRGLWEHIARTAGGKEGGTLIFENDVVIPPDFKERVAAVAHEIPDDWDFIFLDKINEDGDMVSPHVMKLKRDMTAFRNWGFWAFIVRNKSLEVKILPLFQHMLDAVDVQLNKFADTLNLYLLRPSIIHLDQETAGKSTISLMDVQKAGGEVNQSSSPVKVFVYANDTAKPTLKILQTALARLGYEFQILGQGQPWTGFRARMEAYRAAAAAEPADRLLAFLDGYDATVILPATTAAKKFAARPRAAQAPILFSAEPYCLANCAREQLAWYDANPSTPAGQRAQIEAGLTVPAGRTAPAVQAAQPVFLNGGAVMGGAAALASLYEAALATGDEDDQRALGKVVAADPARVDIDVEGALFRSKFGSREREADEGTEGGPVFLHYPGMVGAQNQEKLEALLKQQGPPPS